MKTSIIFVIIAALSIVFPVEWALARGNHRSTLDQKWREIEAAQERQDQRFRAIERNAQRSLLEMDGSKSRWYVVPSDGNQGRRP